jgi:ABC-type molybdate transport system substrate-binding protein
MLSLGVWLSGTAAHSADSLLVFAGAASKPPTEEAAKLYEQTTGVKVELVFGGSGSGYIGQINAFFSSLSGINPSISDKNNLM